MSRLTQIALITFVVIECLVLFGVCHYREISSEMFYKTYFLNANYVHTFSGAQAICEQHNATLLTVDYSSELNWISDNLLSKHINRSENAFSTLALSYWLGASPAGRNSTPTHWRDGQRIEFFDADRDMKPNNESSCNTLAIGYFSGPYYKVLNCDSYAFAICQKTMARFETKQQLATLVEQSSLLVELVRNLTQLMMINNQQLVKNQTTLNSD